VVDRRRLALPTAAALSAATLRPRRAAADRGKDLYTSDGALLQSGGGVVQDALLPQFDSSGALIVGNGYSEETAYRTVRSGPASVEVLKGWVSTDAGGLRDPVTGSAASLVRMSALPTGASSIIELGKPEQLPLVSSLGLEAGLAKADLVAAARRTADGVVFYDYDLALPATMCDDTLAAACLPSLVVLLSACVRDRPLLPRGERMSSSVDGLDWLVDPSPGSCTCSGWTPPPTSGAAPAKRSRRCDRRSPSPPAEDIVRGFAALAAAGSARVG